MARFLRWPDMKSDPEMATDSTDRNQRHPKPDWYAPTVLLTAVGVLALCIGSILSLRTHQAPPPREPVPHPAQAGAETEPMVPWTPVGKVNSNVNGQPPREGPYTVRPDARMLPSDGAFITLLGNGLDSSQFYISKYHNDDSFQGGDWNPDNVIPSPDGLRLDVTPTGVPAKPYALAEVHKNGRYGYGRYETIMRPGKGSGLVSAFFTYTGPYSGDPHEEIDIEFIGKETDVIELNYFHKGKKGAYASIKLPFDASKEDHLYAFDWKPEGIVWYVDGKEIYRTPDGDPGIPDKPSAIIFSNWTGIPAMRQWHGTPDFGDRGSAYYSCISFTPLGENTRRCADIYKPGTRFPAPIN